MSHYKDWKIEVRTNRVPDAKPDAWRVYVDVSRTTGGSEQTVPLSFRDSRTFPNEAEAQEAGWEMAKVWIDEHA